MVRMKWRESFYLYLFSKPQYLGKSSLTISVNAIHSIKKSLNQMKVLNQMIIQNRECTIWYYKLLQCNSKAKD